MGKPSRRESRRNRVSSDTSDGVLHCWNCGHLINTRSYNLTLFDYVCGMWGKACSDACGLKIAGWELDRLPTSSEMARWHSLMAESIKNGNC